MKPILALAVAAALSPSFHMMADAGGDSGACLNTYGLPKWRSHKNVWAAKIAEIKPPTEEGGKFTIHCGDESGYVGEALKVPESWITKHAPEVGGYFVLYQDGYRSYCPAAAFEDGNSPAFDGELNLGQIAHEGYAAKVGSAVRWSALPDEQKRGWNRTALVLSAALAATARDARGVAIPSPADEVPTHSTARALETAWGLIANVSGGDWTKQDPSWVEAAEKFRDETYAYYRPALGTLPPGQLPPVAVNPDVLMRARLKVIEVGDVPTGEGGSQLIRFMAVGPEGNYQDGGLDPDSTFSKWTPTADLSMQIANPRLFDTIRVGDKYHVDFSLCHREPIATEGNPAAAIIGASGVQPTHVAPRDPVTGDPVASEQAPAPKETPADAQPGGEPSVPNPQEGAGPGAGEAPAKTGEGA